MYGLLLTLVLTQAQTPEAPGSETKALVLMVRGSGLSPERGQTLAGEISSVLEKEGIPIAVPPEQVEQRLSALGKPKVDSCNQESECLLGLGRSLGATLIVLLTARDSKEGPLLVDLEAVSAKDGSSVHQDSFLVSHGSQGKLEEGVIAFARQDFRSALKLSEPGPALQPEPRADVPVIKPPPQIIPKPKTPKETPVALKPEKPAPPGQRSRALAYATGGGTLVAIGASVAFGLVGLTQKNKLDDARYTEASTGRTASRLTQREASDASDRANLYANLALTSAIVSAVLGGTTGYLLLKNDSPPKP